MLERSVQYDGSQDTQRPVVSSHEMPTNAKSFPMENKENVHDPGNPNTSGVWNCSDVGKQKSDSEGNYP